MNYFNRLSSIFMLCVLTGYAPCVRAQSPGGVAQGLTAWFKADAGLVMAGLVITTWTNQVANPNLVNVTQSGGASTLADNMPRPFNFNPYVQFNNGCFSKEVLPTFESVIKSDAGSMSEVGTGADQLATVTDQYGCSGSITLAIKETPCCAVGIPNAFSPNNDGTNDQFVPVFGSPVSGYILSVFNRWANGYFIP